jgi:hypothetical protein
MTELDLFTGLLTITVLAIAVTLIPLILGISVWFGVQEAEL